MTSDETQAGGSATTAGTFRYLSPFLKAYYPRLALIFLLTMAGVVLGLTYPYFLQRAVDSIFLPAGGTSGRIGQLRLLAALVFSVSLFQLILSALGGYLHTWVATHLLFDMRSALYKHLLRLPVGFFTNTRVGEVQARMGGDLAEAQAIATGALLQFLGSVLSLVGALAFLLFYSAKLTLVALCFVPPALFLLLRFQKRIHGLAYDIRVHNTGITSEVIETFSSVKTVKAFTAEDHRLDGFRKLNKGMITSVLRFQVTNAFAGGLPGTVLIASSVAVFLVGGSMVLEGTLTVGALIACNIYLARLFGPIQGMIGLYLRIQRARAALDRVFEFLHAGPPESFGSGRKFERLEDGIRLTDVAFGYGSGPAIFEGLDFKIRAGSMIAVVGRSGAGKTTLLDLIAGFSLPRGGEIRFDDRPLGEFDIVTVRSKIGMVVQGGAIFAGSVRENIIFGRGEVSDREVLDACETAGLGSVIDRLGGLDGEVGEKGGFLSAGERERIAIARAVLGDPEILLFDEALGRLDPEGRRDVLAAIGRAVQGRTALLVTHDAEVAKQAEQVIFLTGAGTIKTGDHRRLSESDKEYRSLFAGEEDRVSHAVQVAIVDSGIHRSHPHVEKVGPGMTIKSDEANGETRVLIDGAPDGIGHGTACAGVIYEGTPGVELLPIRLFEKQLRSTPEALERALREALDLSPSIIHLSLGIPKSDGMEAIEEICRLAEERGIVVVSSAFVDREVTPGRIDTVIGVAAGRDMAAGEIRPSGPDELCDLLADPNPRSIPGAPHGANMSGPSFAAARVTGRIARLLAEEPGLSPAEVRSRFIG